MANSIDQVLDLIGNMISFSNRFVNALVTAIVFAVIFGTLSFMAAKEGMIAIMTAGAYGAVQASSYNTRPLIAEVLVNLGDLFARKGCHRRALQVDLRLAQLRPRNATVFYNLACSHTLLSHMTEALAALDDRDELRRFEQ